MKKGLFISIIISTTLILLSSCKKNNENNPFVGKWTIDKCDLESSSFGKICPIYDTVDGHPTYDSNGNPIILGYIWGVTEINTSTTEYSLGNGFSYIFKEDLTGYEKYPNDSTIYFRYQYFNNTHPKLFIICEEDSLSNKAFDIINIDEKNLKIKAQYCIYERDTIRQDNIYTFNFYNEYLEN